MFFVDPFFEMLRRQGWQDEADRTSLACFLKRYRRRATAQAEREEVNRARLRPG